MSYTPGPWIMEGHFVFGPTHELSRHPNGRVLVAEVFRGSHRANPQLDGGADRFSFDSLHDARLIAAAPELYEELREILDYAREVYAQFGGDDEKRGRAPRIREDIVRVEALLKRLDGEDEDA